MNFVRKMLFIAKRKIKEIIITAITFYKQELKGRAEVRLDVQKGTFCKCRIISTKGIKGIFPQNVYKREGEFAYFLSTDSSYMIEMDEDADEIYVEYELIDCEHETRNYLINQLQTVTNENQRVREECDRLRNELSMHNQMEQEDREWQKKLSESKSSRGYQGIQKLKKIGKKIRGTMHEEKKDVVIMLDFSINDHK